jgi:hypothetical protein
MAAIEDFEINLASDMSRPEGPFLEGRPFVAEAFRTTVGLINLATL